MAKTKGDRLFKGSKQFIVALVGEEKAREVMANAYKR